MNLIELISIAGVGGVLGSILTTLIQSWLNRSATIKSRNFKEKKEAYIGLLDAYHQAAITKSNENAKNFAYWQIRCDLVAPLEVRNAIQNIIDTNQDYVLRELAEIKLKKVLRKDLGITK